MAGPTAATETCAQCREPFTPEPGNTTGFCSWECFDVLPRPNAPEAFRVLVLGADTPMVRALRMSPQDDPEEQR